MYNNKKITAIIVAAGSARRMGGIDKQYIDICGMPVLARSTAVFENDPLVDEIIIVVRKGDEEKCRREIVEKFGFKHVADVIAGGPDRQASVRSAIDALSDDTELVLIHDGARPLVTRSIVDAVIAGCAACGAAVPAIPLKDTIKKIKSTDKGTFSVSTPDRSTLRAVQTPQGFEALLLKKAYNACFSPAFTDDASIVEAYGHPVYIVDGDESNIKITTPSDIPRAKQLLNEHSTDMHALKLACFPRTGTGYDVHAFEQGRRLILGGVDIPYERGLAGHSDADVLIHAIMDALLGASGLGDIGRHFPDTDKKYKNISSLKLLTHVAELLKINGFVIINIDATVIAQRPKIAQYIPEMKKNTAQVLKISESQINIKGTTTEHLGFTGREEGIAAQAIASIIRLQEEITT